MKNLKNMLFAAAIGAVAIALPATASAADCTINDKAVTVSSSCALAANSNVKTITVNEGQTLTITGNGTLNATFAGSGKIVANGTDSDDIILKGKFDNKNISGKATIELDPSASFKIDKTLVEGGITFAPNADITRYVIYSDSYTGKNYVTYTCGSKINLTSDAVEEATKTVYVNSASGDYTFKLPSALGNYAYISSENATGVTVSDDKKSVVIDKNTATGTVTITVNTGAVVAPAETINVKIEVIKPTSALIEENDAVAAAIVDDYVAAKNKDAENPSFTTKVSAGTVEAAAKGQLETTYEKANAANNDIKAWAAANGYTVLQYFESTAKVNDTVITVLPKAATVNGDAAQDIVLPTASEGKKVELVVLDLHGDTPEVVDNAVTLNANNKKKFTFKTTKFSPMALAYHIVDATPATETKTDSTETNTGDATKEANPKTSDNVMTSVVSLLVSAFGLTAAGLKLKNN